MWQQILDYLKGEGRVIRGAPLGVVGFCLIVGLLTFKAVDWHYSGQITELQGQNERYRRVLGIAPGSPDALVELTNSEIAAKTKPIVDEIRQRVKQYKDKVNAVDQAKMSGELTENQHFAELMKLRNEASGDFDDGTLSEAINLEHELYKRVRPQDRASVMAPGFSGGADSTDRLTLVQIARNTPILIDHMPYLADELEQLSKLLPPDSQ
jgi:hypothetical protein